MKYFTKYLPVEGEIKEGDRFLHATTNTIEKAVHGSHIPPHKLVKLFLCTSEIKLGDEVIHNEITSTPVTVDNIVKGSVWFQETPGKYAVRDCYKVIGEVSPEAVWVTEGMEFDEEQIQGIGCYKKHPMDSIYFEDLESFTKFFTEHPSIKYRPVIKFECPTCKTFH